MSFLKGDINIYRLTRIIIIIFWMVMMVVLVQKSYLNPYGECLRPSYAAGQLRPKEEWMGIYWGKDKVGYTVSTVKKKMRGYELYEQALMDLTVMGTPQRMDTRVTAQVDDTFTLQSFEFRLFSNLFNFRARGKVRGSELHLEILSGDSTTTTVIPLREIPCLSSSVKPMILAKGIALGQRFTCTLFDPSTMGTFPLEIEIEGKEPIFLKDKQFKCYRIRSSFKGITVRSWIDEEGSTVKEESPLGLLLVKESKADALTENWGETARDIVAASAIPVNQAITVPSPSYLRVRFGHNNLKEYNLSRGRQRLNGDVLEIVREDLTDISSYPVPYAKADLVEYLTPTPFIQSDDALIVRKAQEIIKGERSALGSVRLINQWVYDALEKRPTLSIPNALDVLRMGVGDCNEHATLFVALCRAIGIPSTLCAGIVYTQGSFYYHAWAEVFVGEWVSVDPTMNQLPADATHICFVQGDLDRQLQIIQLIGVLKVEVLDYR